MKDWEPTHIHLKTGNRYKVIKRNVRWEPDWRLAVVYENVIGEWIVRYQDEFDDGRFQEIKE